MDQHSNDACLSWWFTLWKSSQYHSIRWDTSIIDFFLNQRVDYVYHNPVVSGYICIHDLSMHVPALTESTMPCSSTFSTLADLRNEGILNQAGVGKLSFASKGRMGLSRNQVIQRFHQDEFILTHQARSTLHAASLAQWSRSGTTTQRQNHPIHARIWPWQYVLQWD